ncbi:large ribosomal subunit protein bL27m isoform X1 [Gorilla gorilla gorilla]|nr:39S ribosomal protein L27, mitochondrial isoform X1 [Gorilla gorilla gorilla]
MPLHSSLGNKSETPSLKKKKKKERKSWVSLKQKPFWMYWAPQVCSGPSVVHEVTSLLSPTPATALAVRYASKKSGGSSKNLGGKSSGRRQGIKKMEGHYVHAGNIIATQRHFRWHPGAHVGLGKNKCLYALEEGIVRYTKEVYVPHPRNMEAVDLITRLPKGAVLYKTFVHVVPAKPEGTFKLVAML